MPRRPTKIVAGPIAFRLPPALRALRAATERYTGNSPDDAMLLEIMERAFPVAKAHWEKEHQRPLPAGQYDDIRLWAVQQLTREIEAGLLRKNPGEWQGTEKQVAWAKRIKADAEPVIKGWLSDAERIDQADHSPRRSSPQRGMHWQRLRNDVSDLRLSLAITDSRFWIGVRDCADKYAFLRAVRAHFGVRSNPAAHPALSYREAHRWEPEAKRRGVSTVARSSRGFMRMYERAGTWNNVPDAWRRRREAFIARHMAQARSAGERLWEKDSTGKLRPSRRCLALLMWAYRPGKA